jgi:integrase
MKLLADLKVGKLEGAFVFPGDCDGFIDPDKCDAEIWKPITHAAEMAATHFHDLRHFFASQLIANGEIAAYVRDQMGHSSIDVTFDTHSHLFRQAGKLGLPRVRKEAPEA